MHYYYYYYSLALWCGQWCTQFTRQHRRFSFFWLCFWTPLALTQIVGKVWRQSTRHVILTQSFLDFVLWDMWWNTNLVHFLFSLVTHEDRVVFSCILPTRFPARNFDLSWKLRRLKRILDSLPTFHKHWK
jgi:hypothetical protein